MSFLQLLKGYFFTIVFDGRPRKKRNLGAGTGGISGEAPQYGEIFYCHVFSQRTCQDTLLLLTQFLCRNFARISHIIGLMCFLTSLGKSSPYLETRAIAPVRVHACKGYRTSERSPVPTLSRITTRQKSVVLRIVEPISIFHLFIQPYDC